MNEPFPRCPRCVGHPGWAHDDESRRREPDDICRSCFGSGVKQYGLLNAHMFGAERVPGEYVNWSRPDWKSDEDFVDLFGMTVAEYAEANPHMIVFEA